MSEPDSRSPSSDVPHLVPAKSVVQKGEGVPAKRSKPKTDRAAETLEAGRSMLENLDPALLQQKATPGSMTAEQAEEALERHVPIETSPSAAPVVEHASEGIRLDHVESAAPEKHLNTDAVIVSAVDFEGEGPVNHGPVLLSTEVRHLTEAIDEDDDAEVAFALMSVKGAMKVGHNPYIKALKDFNPDPYAVAIEDIVDSDQDFQKAYVESRNNLLTAPRGVRVPFLLSGYHADISSFSHSDTIGTARNLAVDDYVTRTELILNSVFEHILSTSKGDLTFEQWCKITKWPDLESAFFGLYHAAYPGIQKYIVKCHSCAQSFPVDVDNEDLAYITGKYVRDQDVKAVMSGQDAAIKKTLLWKKANPERNVRHILSTTKIIVEYSIPSVQDYVDTIRALQATGKFENVGNIEDRKSTEWPFLRMYPYVNRVALPVLRQTEQGQAAGYRGSFDRNFIVGTLNALSSQDFDSLFGSEEAVDLLNINSIRYSLKPCTCPHCTAPIRAVPINLKNTFFTKVREISDLD